MMAYNTALYFHSKARYGSAKGVAYELAESRMYLDPDAKKIREQIERHEQAIHKLEAKLEKRRAKIAENLLPEAEKVIEEATNIIELRKKIDREFERQLLTGAL